MLVMVCSSLDYLFTQLSVLLLLKSVNVSSYYSVVCIVTIKICKFCIMVVLSSLYFYSVVCIITIKICNCGIIVLISQYCYTLMCVITLKVYLFILVLLFSFICETSGLCSHKSEVYGKFIVTMEVN